MTDIANSTTEYGRLKGSDTLQIERLLPGPMERVWDYLIKGDLRRKWFADGDMEMVVGSPAELVWRNNELTDPPGAIPANTSGESRMQTRVLELDPLRKIAIAWGGGRVSFELEERGSKVLLTIVHSNIPDRTSLLSFAPGWHAHLDLLTSILAGTQPKPFWDEFHRLRINYAELLPA